MNIDTFWKTSDVYAFGMVVCDIPVSLEICLNNDQYTDPL